MENKPISLAAMERHQVREGQVQPELPLPLPAAVRGSLRAGQGGTQVAGRQRQLPGGAQITLFIPWLHIKLQGWAGWAEVWALG